LLIGEELPVDGSSAGRRPTSIPSPFASLLPSMVPHPPAGWVSSREVGLTPYKALWSATAEAPPPCTALSAGGGISVAPPGAMTAVADAKLVNVSSTGILLLFICCQRQKAW